MILASMDDIDQGKEINIITGCLNYYLKLKKKIMRVLYQ